MNQNHKPTHSYYEYETRYWHQHQLVIGVDEAGRGAWAGPVTVAAVVLPINYHCEAIKDSKLLSIKARAKLTKQIQADALSYTVVHIPGGLVDLLNPKQATITGMNQVIQTLCSELNPAIALVDGESLSNQNIKTIALIKGDQRSISIAAASILAKTARDALMVAYSSYYPQYGFDKHKGYGTKFHQLQLNHYNCCQLHRLSYKPIQACFLKKNKI